MLVGWEVTAGLVESSGSLLPGLWLHSVTCGLTAEDRDHQLRNPTLVSNMGIPNRTSRTSSADGEMSPVGSNGRPTMNIILEHTSFRFCFSSPVNIR